MKIVYQTKKINNSVLLILATEEEEIYIVFVIENKINYVKSIARKPHLYAIEIIKDIETYSNFNKNIKKALLKAKTTEDLDVIKTSVMIKELGKRGVYDDENIWKETKTGKIKSVAV